MRYVVVALAFTACFDQPPDPIADAPVQVVEGALGLNPRFTAFESGQVRPLAISPNGKWLYLVNTPDARLEIFDIHNGAFAQVGSVPVGLEPVAVAARSNSEVWVVNHLSDSVSIVDVSHADEAQVVETLLVGDEPRDLVFAGHQNRKAFITTAHRGQNSPVDAQQNVEGVGRADVWVFDAQHLGDDLGGEPETIITLFADTPRALAVSPDGKKVYAAAFESGNRTTTISEPFIPDGGEGNGGLPFPNTNFEGATQPETSLIVRFIDGHWYDDIGRIWDSEVEFTLPDKDVFVIDADASPPVATSTVYTGVGTVLFNMAVHPTSGKIFVSNTDAKNDVRFEGPGVYAGDSVRGHLAESRISILSNGAVTARHLNKHIDYDTCCAAIPNAENAKSLAFPTGMAFNANGTKLYVAALGSSKVGVFDTAALENDTFVPSTTNQITVSGGGPTGLVLDPNSNRMFVATRFDNGISVVNTTTKTEVQHRTLFNPEPASITTGRRFLYDAKNTSSHGDSACASCHIFGDFDSLSWDLGNPDESEFTNNNPVIELVGPFAFPHIDTFKPMKGPMNTQSLRGLANHGPMHWRGDRTGSVSAPNAQPDSGAFDENAAFNAFNVAFEGLLGRSAPLPASDMQAFTDFMLQVSYPPNPNANLDNSLTPAQQVGRDHYFQPLTTFGAFACNDCHVLNPQGNAEFGVQFPGFFGSSGFSSFDSTDDGNPFRTAMTPVKAPHLRNLYQKVGMFGVPSITILGITLNGTGFLGDQVRGFGNTHDGSVPLMFFLSGFVFSDLVSPNGFAGGFTPDGAFIPLPAGQVTLDSLFDFLMAYPSNHAPIVGQQVTLGKHDTDVAGPRVDLLEQRHAAGECELVAKGHWDDEVVGYLYLGSGQWKTDHDTTLSDANLRKRAKKKGDELTFTCTPLGSGRRMGVDADLDGYLDGVERDGCSDPRDASDVP